MIPPAHAVVGLVAADVDILDDVCDDDLADEVVLTVVVDLCDVDLAVDVDLWEVDIDLLEARLLSKRFDLKWDLYSAEIGLTATTGPRVVGLENLIR